MSSWDDLRLQVTPGNGVVVRSAAALLVVPAFGQHQESALEQLVSLVRDSRSGSGRAMARKVAAIIASSEPEDVPDLALLAGLSGESVAVLVLGEAEVSAETSSGPVTLSGRESLTWVDRVISGPTRIVVAMPGEAEPTPMRYADLLAGVVPGGGALLEARDAQGASAAPVAAAAAAAAAPASSVGLATEPGTFGDEPEEASSPAVSTAKAAPMSLAPPPPPPSAPQSPVFTGAPTDAMPASEPMGQDFGDDEHAGHDHAGHDHGLQTGGDFQVEPLGGFEPEQREPLPVEPEDQAAGSAQPEQVQSDLVEGVYCKRGHFTDPDSQFCIVCGIGLYETKIKRKGVRPELGFLVFDDGSVFHLDHDYVLGRQPEVDEEVKAGTVRGLRLEDSGGTVSRAHAIVRLVGWNVTIADRKSQNGTLVAPKGSEQFVPVPRDQPITLVPGSRIQLGQRTLVYESQRGRS